MYILYIYIYVYIYMWNRRTGSYTEVYVDSHIEIWFATTHHGMYAVFANMPGISVCTRLRRTVHEIELLLLI